MPGYLGVRLALSIRKKQTKADSRIRIVSVSLRGTRKERVEAGNKMKRLGEVKTVE